LTFRLKYETIKTVQTVTFHPGALQTIRAFPKSTRHKLGEAILDLQHGAQLTMPLSRPMPSVAPGAQELRVRDAAGTYRAFYLLHSQRGLIVFHAFEKRTQKTPDRDIRLGRKRLQEMLYE
jgi:phage-related protein